MDTETKDFLQSIADRLGVTIDKVYGIMLKQVKIDAIMGIVFQVLMSISLFVLYKLWLVWIPFFVPTNPHAASYDQNYPTWVCLSGVALGIVSLICVIGFLVSIGDCISDTVTAYINPESVAIEKISSFMKK